MSFLTEMTATYWFILAFALLILEALLPGAFFLAIGLAAAVVGLIVALMPEIAWHIQWSIFGVISLALVVAWFIYRKKNPRQDNQTKLNRRGRYYVGREFTLDHPIVNGIGKIRVDDSSWKVRGEDLPAGTQVMVTGVDGVILLVEEYND